MNQDRITLTVPARGEYAKTVRLTAASLVSRMGMGYDDVEDVRMAAEEAFVYAVETAPQSGQLTFEFLVDGDAFTLAVGLGTDFDPTDEDMEARTSYATFILQSVSDSYELTSDEHGNASLTVTKRAESIDAH